MALPAGESEYRAVHSFVREVLEEDRFWVFL